MFTEYLLAFLFIFAAEMGDKTQILAMMFATKYTVKTVVLGVFLGSLLNHGLAIAFGTLLGSVIQVQYLQLIAGLAFLGFAFWTLLDTKSEAENEAVEKNMPRSGFITVASAFFIGELGDKTQLTAISLSLDATWPLLILLGTVSGMIVTSLIGIVIGRRLGHKIPEVWIRLGSSGIFLIFGLLKVTEVIVIDWPSAYVYGSVLLVLIAFVAMFTRAFIKTRQASTLSPYQKAAKALYAYAHQSEQLLDALCLKAGLCGRCADQQCGINLMRHIIEDIWKKEVDHSHTEAIKQLVKQDHNFDPDTLRHMLAMTVPMIYKDYIAHNRTDYQRLDDMRKVIEMLLFDDYMPLPETLEAYEAQVGVSDHFCP